MKTVKIYWSDLTLSKQKEIIELLGDNGNYDVFPLTIIEYEEESYELPVASDSQAKTYNAVSKENDKNKVCAESTTEEI